MLDFCALLDIYWWTSNGLWLNTNSTTGGDKMNKLYSFVSKVLLFVGLISLILAVIVKFFEQFAYFGIFPLSYLRFAGVCLLFVIASSLAQMTAGKQPQKKRRR
jgi:hypothetical protein